jgi:hypothetical protein
LVQLLGSIVDLLCWKVEVGEVWERGEGGCKLGDGFQERQAGVRAIKVLFGDSRGVSAV